MEVMAAGPSVSHGLPANGPHTGVTDTRRHAFIVRCVCLKVMGDCGERREGVCLTLTNSRRARQIRLFAEGLLARSDIRMVCQTVMQVVGHELSMGVAFDAIYV